MAGDAPQLCDGFPIKSYTLPPLKGQKWRSPDVENLNLPSVHCMYCVSDHWLV